MTKEEVEYYLEEFKNEQSVTTLRYFVERLDSITDKEVARLILDKFTKPDKPDGLERLRARMAINLISRLDWDEALEYLTPEHNLVYELTRHDLGVILKHFKELGCDVSRFFLDNQKDLPDFVNSGKSEMKVWSTLADSYRFNCNANLIKACGKEKITDYLTPENAIKYGLYADDDTYEGTILSLICELDKNDREKYLFKTDNANKLTDLSIVNLIYACGPEKIRESLSIKNAKGYLLAARDITKLINLLSEEEQNGYLLPNQRDRVYGWRNIFYHGTENEKIKDLITQMYEKNHSLLLEYSELLDDEDIIEFLNEDMISYLSFYHEGNDFAQLDSFTKRLVLKLIAYFMRENQTDEWTLVFEQIMSKINSPNNEMLIDSLDEEQLESLKDDDLAFLFNIIVSGNKYELKSLADKEDYLTNLENNIKAQNRYSSYSGNNFSYTGFGVPGASVKNLIGCVIECKFGISYEEALQLVDSFGQDIDYIQNDDLKVFIKTVTFLIEFAKNYEKTYNQRENNYFFRVVSSEKWGAIKEKTGNKYLFVDYDEDDLSNVKGVIDDRFKTIIDNIKPIENIGNVNYFQIEKLLRKEYMKLYKSTLFSIKDAEKISGEDGVYELPKDEKGFVKKYNTVVTSLAAYRDFSSRIVDYYDFWNRPEITSLHFCGTYIGRNMNCTARITNLCFGYNNLSEDSLLMSSYRDIGSDSQKIHSESYRYKYIIGS